MSSSVGNAKRLAVAQIQPQRWICGVRAASLLTIGLVITFTKDQHTSFSFGKVLLITAVALIGAAHLLAWGSAVKQAGAPITLLLGLISCATAAGLIAANKPFALGLGLAAWAIIGALLEFASAPRRAGRRPDAALIGGASILLAACLVLFRHDLLAITGFFGGYAMLTGVFLGIATFDATHHGALGGASHPSGPAALPAATRKESTL